MSVTTKANQDVGDAKESTTIRFEWTLRGLKNLFENSKGEAKSKVTKSPRFGDDRWQILFYANSGNVGTDGQTFVSLYLACEPTTAERANAVNGKWSREGLFNFGFEIRNVPKTIQFNLKEAHDHSFYYPGAQNWGWAQFARRDAVYYQPATVRQQDAFAIICTITSAPATPAPAPAIPRYYVPKDLLDSMGGLLDDPMYSDVEFVLPQRGKVEPRKIYAARRLLRRVDYFDAMFHSGFAESSAEIDALGDTSQTDDASVSDVGAFAFQFDDSDYEDDEDLESMSNDQDLPIDDTNLQETPVPDDLGQASATTMISNKRTSVSGDEVLEFNGQSGTDDVDEQDQSARNTRPKLSHPSTPRSRELALEQQEEPSRSLELRSSRKEPDVLGPKKARVVIRDVAYATYRAVLYYLYTDTIAFAPLSSSFLSISAPAATPHGTLASTPAALSSEHQPSFFRVNQQQPSEAAAATTSIVIDPRSRKEWIAEWERTNPGRSRPPSAKSVYRLADKLGLQDLKDRAFQHIIKSLTVDNVVHEAFSAFSAAFEDVRKVQVAYMFEHWNHVRKGAMLNIGQQLRLGRYPGFEEVWPAIIQNLITDDKKGENSEGSKS
ncbi:hypothetical protein C8Q74DRAFT_1201937 [Fomes fomentarius]|nr:hypothetical protein C8Q74DRAFT_1201937 [Fomes fomentarius]